MLSRLEARRPPFWIATGLVCVAGVGAVNVWAGSEMSLSLFYLIPSLLVTWFAGRAAGLAIGVAGTGMWLAADVLSGQTYSHTFIRYWNAGARLVFFVLVTLLLPALKELEREKQTARVDPLTGVANRRFFFEVAQRELDRSQRNGRSLSIVFLDPDRFKTVNDELGHHVGDEVLRTVATHAKAQLRKTDVIARVGGDEFVVLLPEADQDASRAIVSRIQRALSDEMRRSQLRVTFSIGVLTCHSPELTPDELVTKADELMYSVKRRGKNGVAYAVYPG